MAPPNPAAAGGKCRNPQQGHQEVHFQTASRRRVEGVLHRHREADRNSAQEPVGEEPPADLYEFEITSKPDRTAARTLSDLTADSTSGSGDVLNLIPGTSSDGTTVYFVANGVLCARRNARANASAAQKTKRTQPCPSATCNLYSRALDSESGEWQAPRFIAALSYRRRGGLGRGLTSNLPPSEREPRRGHLERLPGRPLPGVHVAAEPHRL